jgi:hypothetical protein
MIYRGYRLRHIWGRWYVTRAYQVFCITPAFYDAREYVERQQRKGD